MVGLLSGEIVQDMSDDYSNILLQQNLSTNMTDSILAEYKISVACSLALFVGVVQLIMVYSKKYSSFMTLPFSFS